MCALVAADAGLPPRVLLAPFGVDRHAMEQARISGKTLIRRPGQELDVEFLVTVSPDGRVAATRPGNVYGAAGPTDVPAAEAAVRAWRFRPFQFGGRAVAAIGTVSLGFLPPARPSDPRARFPDSPLRDVRIVLERTQCYGNCPAYRVEIRGDGSVLFTSKGWDAEKVDAGRWPVNATGILAGGPHRDRIPPAHVAALVQRFRDAHFFGLARGYHAEITDSATYTLSLRIGASAKRVEDYVGEQVGMPPSVTALEDAVDAAAGTVRWIKGDAATADALAAEGLDFASAKAQRIAYYAVTDGDAAVFPGLLRHGLPLGAPAAALAQPQKRLGEVLILTAIRRRRAALVTLLADRGWLARLPKAELSSAFAQGGGGGDPVLPARLVAAGADPAARDSEGHTALMNAVGAVAWLKADDVIATIRPLAAAGVPLEALDNEGRTALYHASYEAAVALLAAGARADMVDRNGRSPAVVAWDDRTAVLLLEAGASPAGRGDDGKTLRERAAATPMPATLTWLDARKVK
jgi:hypothetical protein